MSKKIKRLTFDVHWDKFLFGVEGYKGYPMLVFHFAWFGFIYSWDESRLVESTRFLKRKQETNKIKR